MLDVRTRYRFGDLEFIRDGLRDVLGAPVRFELSHVLHR